MTGTPTEGIKTVLHPVSDLAKAKPVYEALLGVAPSADAPYYVGFDAAGQHIGLVPGGGPQAMSSPVASTHRSWCWCSWRSVLSSVRSSEETSADDTL